MNHPSPDLLVQLAAGLSSEAEAHVRECSECSAAVEEIRDVLDVPAADDGSESESRRLARERDLANKALKLIPGVSDEDVGSYLERSDAFRTTGGVQELIDWVPSVRWSQPTRALIVSRAIVAIADQLSGDHPSLLDELRVAARRELASAHRALANYDEAFRILETVEPEAEALPLPDLPLARIWYERARTLVDLGKCEEARRWSVIAADAFERFGDLRRRDRAGFLIAACFFNSWEFEAATKAFEELLDKILMDGDLPLIAATQAAIGHLYARSDRLPEAREHLVASLGVFRERGMVTDALRAEWGLARIRTAEGDYRASASDLKRISKRFESLGLLEESNLVKLDLYEALVLLDEWGEAERMIRQSLEFLAGRFTDKEQERALGYLREIVVHRNVERQKLRDISDFLNLSRHNPRLSFPLG